MRELEDSDTYKDPQRALQRQRELIAGLKELEFRLRQNVEEPESRTLPLSGRDAVPSSYRDLVEEYFRTLSRSEHD